MALKVVPPLSNDDVATLNAVQHRVATPAERAAMRVLPRNISENFPEAAAALEALVTKLNEEA